MICKYTQLFPLPFNFKHKIMNTGKASPTLTLPNREGIPFGRGIFSVLNSAKTKEGHARHEHTLLFI